MKTTKEQRKELEAAILEMLVDRGELSFSQMFTVKVYLPTESVWRTLPDQARDIGAPDLYRAIDRALQRMRKSGAIGLSGRKWRKL